MKKTGLILLATLILITFTAATEIATINMLNGDTLQGVLNMTTFNFITDYGEMTFPVDYVSAIQFPAPGNRITEIKSIYKNECFGGFLLDDRIDFTIQGNNLSISRDQISTITLNGNISEPTGKGAFVKLRTGDAFYARIIQPQVNIRTSYGKMKFQIEDIQAIAFEGTGNVLSTINLTNGNEIKGVIEDEWLSLKLLMDQEMLIVPAKIERISFGTFSEVSESPFVRERMVKVKGGTFRMGNKRNDSEGADDEKPVHTVTLTYDYYIGKYEVTFDEFDQFCEETGRQKPSDYSEWAGYNMGRGNKPVVNVTWYDAIAFCNWLSEKEGLKVAYDNKGNFLDKNGNKTTDITTVEGYRLPTEAEWEYAARGGHKSSGDYKYAGSNDIDEVAWYWRNSGNSYLSGDWDGDKIKDNYNKTHEVGQKKPNELGIFDMSGNAWEMCQDYWDENYYEKSPTKNPWNFNSSSDRVLRGGSWYSNANYCRVAIRYYWRGDDYCSNDVGFRLARTSSF